MGLPISTEKRYTLEEYLDLADRSETRLEFENGKIVDMGKTTDTHAELAFNTASDLKPQASKSGCKVYIRICCTGS
ncbi:MAG: hypothetical protein AAGC85_05685 [Bacteroidota bacterium]